MSFSFFAASIRQSKNFARSAFGDAPRRRTGGVGVQHLAQRTRDQARDAERAVVGGEHDLHLVAEPLLQRLEPRCLAVPEQQALGPEADDQRHVVAEFQVRVAVLNGFTALGTPITEVAG